MSTLVEHSDDVSESKIDTVVEKAFDEDDDEDDDDIGVVQKKKKRSFIRAIESSDDEDEERKEEKAVDTSQEEPANTSMMNLLSNKDIYDAEGSSDSEVENKVEPSSSRSSSRSVSPVNEEDAMAAAAMREQYDSMSDTAKSKKRQDRKSKEAAMQEIYSEKQRMFRESRVGLPYHRPRQRTLDDFLARKKCLDVFGNDIKFKVKDDTGEAEKLLEEQEKLAEAFFREEEVDKPEEDQEVDKTSEPVQQVDQTLLEPVQEVDKSEPVQPEPAQEPTLVINDDGLGAGQEESLDHDIPTTEQVDSETKNKESTSDKEEEEESMCLFLEPDSEQIPEETRLKGNKFDLSHLKDTLNKTPKLGGGLEKSEIVLEEAEPNPGVEDFISRFSRHAAATGPAKQQQRKKDAKVDITVVTKQVDADGNEQLKKETFGYKVDFSAVRDVKNVDKPGAQLLALKTTLKQKMSEKRQQERQKRQEQKQLDNLEDGFADGEEEEEEELDDEESESSSGESEPPEEDEDAYVNMEKKKRVKHAFVDDEAEDDEDEAEDDIHLALDDNGDNEEEEEEKGQQLKLLQKDALANSTPTLAGPGGRSISKIVSDVGGETPLTLLSNSAGPRWTPFDERSQDEKRKSLCNDDDDDDMEMSQQSVRKKLGFEGLFDTSDPKVSDLDDVIGLCSGQFATQKQISQMMMQDTPDTVVFTQNLSQTDMDTQEVEEAQKVDLSNLLDSDSGEESKQTQTQQQQQQKKKRKCKVLSDDDDSSAAEESDNSVDKEDKEVLYDSEENEVETPAADVEFKGFKSKKGIRREFLENEAELSGSDAGSGDEDERGLDHLMMEEGDLDELDEDEVRDQVGRLHHRRVLDEDKRDVRIFQEAFLEDGELHSENTRSRKFRWKGIDDDIGTLEIRKSDSEGEEETNEHEEKRRLERLDREKWLEESDGKELVNEDEDSQFFNMASKAMKKLDSKAAKRGLSTSSLPKAKDFKSPKAKMPLQLMSGNQRGSFLSRCSGSLEKLAEMTKGKSESHAGTTAKNTNNFVFAAISPSKTNVGKQETKANKSIRNKSSSKREPATKKVKIDRTLDENSDHTIFGLM